MRKKGEIFFSGVAGRSVNFSPSKVADLEIFQREKIFEATLLVSTLTLSLSLSLFGCGKFSTNNNSSSLSLCVSAFFFLECVRARGLRCFFFFFFRVLSCGCSSERAGARFIKKGGLGKCTRGFGFVLETFFFCF